MTSRRFSLVLRGLRGTAARTKYLQHLEGLANDQDGIGTRGNRPASVDLYIVPFALPLGSTVLIEASALSPAWNIFKNFSEVSSRVKTELTDGQTSVKLRTYAPPRVIRRQVTDTAGRVETSKLTGLKYLKYNTQTNSIPFGKKTGDTAPFDVFEEIVQQAQGSATNLRFSFVEERV